MQLCMEWIVWNGYSLTIKCIQLPLLGSSVHCSFHDCFAPSPYISHYLVLPPSTWSYGYSLTTKNIYLPLLDTTSLYSVLFMIAWCLVHTPPPTWCYLPLHGPFNNHLVPSPYISHYLVLPPSPWSNGYSLTTKNIYLPLLLYTMVTL